MNSRFTLPIVFAFAFPHLVMPAQAQVVPGTGQQIVEVFDDFEDPTWSYTLNLPKSSANIDKIERHPSGFSNNRLFLESLYRGTPDFVRRIETPPGGISGSTGSLAMQTMNSGIPGQTSNTFQQDDLIAGVQQKLGYMIPVSWTPSYVCRVYVPPFDKWERRHGSHFGYRADCVTTIDSKNSMGRFFKKFGSQKKLEQYWPGFFIQLNMKNMTGQKEDFATILIRSDDRGHEVPGPNITKPGWWTLGMSFTSDGKVHYYGHEGVANLTAKDHLYSGFPYGYHCEQTSTYFFNIVNQDDGHTWSTRWIVDDPKVYVATGNYRPPVQQQAANTPPATVQSQPPAAKPITSNVSATAVQSKTVLTAPAASAASTTSAPQIASKPMDSPATAPKTENAPTSETGKKDAPASPSAVPELKTAAETPAATTEPTESNGSTTEEASGSTESASDSTGVPPIPQ
jgi:hypothetical protein